MLLPHYLRQARKPTQSKGGSEVWRGRAHPLLLTLLWLAPQWEQDETRPVLTADRRGGETTLPPHPGTTLNGSARASGRGPAPAPTALRAPQPQRPGPRLNGRFPARRWSARGALRRGFPALSVCTVTGSLQGEPHAFNPPSARQTAVLSTKSFLLRCAINSSCSAVCSQAAPTEKAVS